MNEDRNGESDVGANREQPSNDTSSPELTPPEPNDSFAAAPSSITDQQIEEGAELRQGTITSARFNILSTMVGGGCLSLPLAFYQAGNSLLGPILLMFFAYLVRKSIDYLVQAAIFSHPSDDTEEHKRQKGSKSFDSVACAAFGPKAKYFTMGLLATICFFTIVGYAVLLRDMLLPLSDLIFGNDVGGTGPSFHHNLTMLTIIVIVTPLCTLKDLTPLEKIGALSMMSIFTVACCISYRSAQCNFSPSYESVRLMPWYEYVNFVPSAKQGFGSAVHDLLNSLPILISVFMCHFNVLPVHNEFSDPSPQRVNTLFSSSIWGACIFYIFVGFSGSMYGNCTAEGMVEGNILLSFREDDVLLLVGKVCLSLTITAAFPVLVVPCRDIALRALSANSGTDEEVDLNNNALSEPLLANDHNTENSDERMSLEDKHEQKRTQKRRIASVIILWTAAVLACCVESIDIVWDILGGSLSLVMGFLIPSGSFIVLSKVIERSQLRNSTELLSEEGMPTTFIQGSFEESSIQNNKSPKLAYFLLVLFLPLIVILTGNAVYNLST